MPVSSSDYSRYRHLKRIARDPDVSPRKRERAAERAKAVLANANASAAAAGLPPPMLRDKLRRDDRASDMMEKARSSLYREELWRSHRANFLDSNSIRGENLLSIRDSSETIGDARHRLAVMRSNKTAYVNGELRRLGTDPLTTSGPLSPHDLRFLERRRERLADSVDDGARLGSHATAGRDAHVLLATSDLDTNLASLARVDARLADAAAASATSSDAFGAPLAAALTPDAGPVRRRHRRHHR